MDLDMGDQDEVEAEDKSTKGNNEGVEESVTLGSGHPQSCMQNAFLIKPHFAGPSSDVVPCFGRYSGTLAKARRYEWWMGR